jgi:hypothetical protein
MKLAMFDKIMAVGLILVVYGMSLNAEHRVSNKSLVNPQEVTVIEQGDNLKNKMIRTDYSQIRKEYQWDLDGAGEYEDALKMWD